MDLCTDSPGFWSCRGRNAIRLHDGGGGETSVKNHSQVFNNDSCHYCSSLTLSALSHSLCFVLFVLSLFWSFLFSDSWLPLNGVPSSSLVIATFFLPAVAKFLYRIFRVFSPILNAKQQIFLKLNWHYINE